MGFQGSVLGPGLCDMTYEAARLAVRLFEFIAAVYANDLNALNPFVVSVLNSELVRHANVCQ